MIVCLLALSAVRQHVLKLSPLFSDNMVLERDVRDPFFGIAEPGEAVTVSMNGLTATTVADNAGKWTVRFPALPAGGPFVAKVSTPANTVTINNVMVGEVWVCSGQSNMEFRESQAADYVQAQAEADPSIRLFNVAKVSTETPAASCQGEWTPASKTTVGGFSAVALAFGRELHAHLGVPIGLIQSSWGGTRAEAWTSRDALNSNAALKPLVDAYLADSRYFDAKNEAFRADLRSWIASRSDKGNEGYLQGWAQPHVYETDWKAETLPGTMDSMLALDEGQSFDGAVWFRRTFQLPQEWDGKAVKLQLGPVADYDDTYVNGVKVGSTKTQIPDLQKQGRTYRISPGILHEGENSIAIRVFAAQGTCGLTGLPDQMCLTPWGEDNPTDPVPLAGQWMMKIESKVELSDEAPHMPLGPGSPKAPGGLFNGMISPLIPYGVKGVIWYQGESNVGDASQYRTLFPTMIRDWRQRWGEGQMPFYFVQLANFKPRLPDPGDSDWAQLREAQAVALKMNHTGMAVALDLGEADTIHPKDKRDVGHRLALIALSKDYSQHVAWNGPELNSMAIDGVAIRLFFQHIGDGLKTIDGSPIRGFAVAGPDRKFYWAEAKIQGTAIVISSPSVPAPVAVRYGWADNPDCNLYNSDGLPAAPFRTDNWASTSTKS